MGHIDAKSFDWQGAVLTQGNLIPGEPSDVARLGKQLRGIADEINKQAANLRNLVDGEGWDSDSGRAFAGKVGDTASLLQKAFGRYDEAAKALGTNVRASGPHDEVSWPSGTEWASTLELAQVKAQDALNRGKTADTDSQTAQKQINAAKQANHGQPDTSPAATKLADQQTASDGDLQNAANDLNHAIDIRDSEGKAVAGQINDYINTDGLKNPKHHWWDVDWKDLVADIGHIAGAIAGFAGILALALAWVPILGEVLGAIALIAGAIALVCDTISALDGKGNWFDVAIDVVGLLSCGAGRAIGSMAKAADTIKVFDTAFEATGDLSKSLKFADTGLKDLFELKSAGGILKVGVTDFLKGMTTGPLTDLGKEWGEAGEALKAGKNIFQVARGGWNGLAGFGPNLVKDSHWGFQLAGWGNATFPLGLGLANLQIPTNFGWEPGFLGPNLFKSHNFLGSNDSGGFWDHQFPGLSNVNIPAVDIAAPGLAEGLDALANL
ncbi:hypothetical protein KGQ19_17660 [Catenulispora sp. NL8]|uniref:WXG100 family type VII secretion target n=1 Tax=Catenulispora pinistramenti TaxID=2705254 RepID=A0ABS5KRM3_9ACTN|nr:hypothetical protein [Catenulispora pinistramenti]MBS2548698.1 hypothetical protein [Catenulispora pinistramenti]